MGVYDEGLNERDNLDEVVEEDTIQVGISSTRCSSSSSGASKRGRGVVLRWKPWIRVSEIRIPLQIHEALPLIHFPPPLLFLLWMLKIAESKATHFTLAGKKSYTTRSCRRERKLERERPRADQALKMADFLLQTKQRIGRGVLKWRVYPYWLLS